MMVVDPKTEIASFVAERIPGFYLSPQADYSAVGFTSQGRLVCGVVFTNYQRFDVSVHIAAEAPWPVREMLRETCRIVFSDWGCERMTALIGQKNKRARRFVEGIGFRLEGKLEKGLDGTQHAILYGMTRERCRWLH